MSPKRKIAIISAIVVVIIIVVIVVIRTTEKPFDEQVASQLQAVLDDAVEKSGNMVNGALMYVSGRDLGTWTGASGVRIIGTNTTARPNDKFRGGSIMKPFVAVVILQLIEEGRLSLDDPMTNVLPASVTGKFANSNNITVRMLLNHTAGIPEWLGEAQINEIAANPAKIWEVEEYIDLAAGQEPYFDPGEGIYYSNTDYNLLGMVIDQVTGHAWREEVRERIIEELNLENTVLPEPGEIFIPADHIRGYLPMGGQLIDATGVDPSMAGAAGGHALVTTATDLTVFLDAVLAGELFQNQETLEEMLTFEEADPYGMPVIPGIEWEYYGYGLGLEKWILPDGVELIGHAGSTAGFTATVYNLPAQDITIASAWGIDEMREFFIRLILPALDVLVPEFEMPQPTPISASTPPITDADGNVIPGSIATIETVVLGGVEQTVTIRGANTTKPVLLFLHGGPGVPSSPWATWNNVHADLEANFVLVHWDQRGAGKSYSEDLTTDDMHSDNFVSDTLELTDILRERFDQDKIFLWGHSWGSGLGFETLRVDSEPYYAYIASAVRPSWNSTQEMGYEKVLEIAREANDAEAIQALESIQPFDPANPDHIGMRGQFLSQYLVGDFHTEGLEEAWLNYVTSGMSPEYPSGYLDQTVAGMDFSRQTILLEVVTSGYDLATDFPVSTIPVHFIHGRYDYECPGELAEEYYNSLVAPSKSFTWFENSAHDVYYDEPDAFNQEMIRIANLILNED